MSKVKKSIITAICIALCVVLPLAFHSVPNAGSIFCPMHIPVLLCGLICGGPLGLLCGLAGPLLSSLMTGMPPAAILPAMMVELAAYGLLAGLIMKLVRTGSAYADLYISLAAAMLGGRILSGIAKALIFAKGTMSMSVWASSYFVTSLPGIIIQLAIIPSLVFTLMKANLIPERYPKSCE
ncbi:MAG: ECF transporter S component [Bacillota bacterium]|nr:ECF transporter S component [Bacillota bacterium]